MDDDTPSPGVVAVSSLAMTFVDHALAYDERILNRELSWLDFNARVLALAADENLPLLERAKFCAIFSSNLDEFFQVRVAALKDQVAAGLHRPGPDGRTPVQQLAEIASGVDELIRQQEAVFANQLVPELAAHGIRLLRWAQLDGAAATRMRELFERRVFPVLTPLSVDPGHPFPYISTLSLNLAVEVVDPVSAERRFARVKVPPTLPRLVEVGDGAFIALEELIAANVGELFPGMTVDHCSPFRVTRNADLTLEEEEADDLLEAVEMELRRRRFGRAVRLEITGSMPAQMQALLVDELDLAPADVFAHGDMLDLTGLLVLTRLDRPDLTDPDWPALVPAVLADAADQGRSIYSVLRDRDLLVHHPYESFTASVEEFIRQASSDPRVLAIKMTLYRTSGDSPILQHLMRAAERGIQVAVLVELKARFDEQRNIEWAKRLERAGVHVVYGLVGLKTHSKTILVVRDEADGVRRYCHVGTGNYNSSTARVYEDLGLFTCDPDLGSDLGQLFNHLTGYSRETRYRSCLVAPRWLRHQLQDLIEAEARLGSEGRVTIKVNSISDPVIIESLYAASAAGVSVDLIVRGICCLRPGVPGLSENIRVRSLLGRYLEHSRIYGFGHADEGRPLWLIGSADLMPRNLDGRVETLVPIRAPELQRRIREVLDTCLADDAMYWTLDPDGRWTRGTRGHNVAQHRMREAAVARSVRVE